MGVFGQIQREGQMPLPLGQGTGQAVVKQQSLCSCQLLPKTLDRDLPFPGPLGDLDISGTAVAALVEELQISPVSSSTARRLTLLPGPLLQTSFIKSRLLSRALLSGSEDTPTLEETLLVMPAVGFLPHTAHRVPPLAS